MKKISISIVVLLTSSLLLPPSVANAGSICNNGKYSTNSGRGTCSSNGGVNKNFPSYSDPYSSSYKRNNGLGSGLNSNGLSTKKKCPKYSYIC
jgi:hypothetical protein